MICKKEDCFNCPYPDCINDGNGNTEARKKYYLMHKEKLSEYNKKYQKKIKEKRRANGICMRCGKRAVAKNSKSFCSECLIKRREYNRERQKKTTEKRRESGLCVQCGKRPIAQNSKSRCPECLIKHRKYAVEYRKKNKGRN